MKVGFTGTQKGLTKAQKLALEALAQALEIGEFHYGDCIGADDEAARIFFNFGWPLVQHPPDNPSKRANLQQILRPRVVMHERPYLDRNRDIVDQSDILIACPKSRFEEIRSGTWATVRYARKKGRKVVVVWPY